MNLGLCLWLCACSVMAATIEGHDVPQSRTKRIVFPENAAMGIIFAIAVPFIVPGRNIFMSYNFEGNYNSPADATIFTEGFGNFFHGVVEQLTSNPLPLQTGKRSVDVAVQKKKKKKNTTAHITRRKLYKVLRRHLESQGFKGKACMLRMICDAAQNPIHEYSGLLGDVVQLLLSPSLSTDENLSLDYSLAEQHGAEGSCDRYMSRCPVNPLESILLSVE